MKAGFSKVTSRDWFTIFIQEMRIVFEDIDIDYTEFLKYYQDIRIVHHLYLLNGTRICKSKFVIMVDILECFMQIWAMSPRFLHKGIYWIRCYVR